MAQESLRFAVSRTRSHDRDPILAVIKGSAVNNDGQRKVGYLAPSVDGHADVVKEALAVAGLSARDLQLLEAHGTGTSVGDPIEVAALTQAFRVSTPDLGFCHLVSTKPNIGHLDTAAGVASLIKVIQAMRHRTLPPLANHTAPSPLIDIERTPFLISAEPLPWPDDAPRRAGVSSLGVGGTNAHVVVEEAPLPSPTPAARPEQLLALSAVDGATLDLTARRLADALEAEPGINLADVAHTLAVGRRAMPHRRVLAVTDVSHAIDVLRQGDRNRVASAIASNESLQVAFLFPGGGAHYAGMAAGLDDRFDVFHDVMHDGLRRLRQCHGLDLAPLLEHSASPDALRKATASLPAVFLTSVALARQWMAWGVTPTAFVGHSLGEYTAAHLSGVISIDDALELIVARATLMDRVSGVGAAMLAVPLPVEEVEPLLPSSLSVATVNADDECVIAGHIEDIEILAKQIANEEIQPTLIPLDAAAHSALLDPILAAFLEDVRRIELSPPQIPYLSNLTGSWITAEEATSAQYWVDHLRQTVRFSDCLRTALSDGPMVMLEMGPGHSLSSYARRQPVKPVAAIPVLRHPNQDIDDTAAALLAAGRAWTAGLDIDVDRFAGPERRLLRLPGYPFRRVRHWIEPGEALSTPVVAEGRSTVVVTSPTTRRVADLTDAFWARTWVERTLNAPAREPEGPWLVVAPPGDQLARELVGVLVARGAAVDATTTVDDGALLGKRSVVIVGPTADLDAAIASWMTGASMAARALGAVDGGQTLLVAVTRGATDAGGPATAPLDAMALGIVRTAPREYEAMRTALIDLDPTRTSPNELAADAAAIVAELVDGSDQVVAHRRGQRLVPRIERERVGPAPAEAITFRHRGRYLVTGGLGDVGFAIASSLATRHSADLAIVTSREVPEPSERAAWLVTHGPDDATSRRILRLQELESLGTNVITVAADVADSASLRAALTRVEGRLGRLDGAVHAAGELRDRPIELATEQDNEIVLGAKARGAVVLADELERRGADLLVLISSTSTELAPEGQASYVAANSVLDALAGDREALRVRTLSYGIWRERGAVAVHRARLGLDDGEPVSHPVLSEISVDRGGDTHVVGTLTTRHHWLLDEHRTTDGAAVLPGTGHLELYLAAAELAGAGTTIGSVTLLDPLVVRDAESVTVRVTVASPDDDGSRWARLESDAGVGSWRLHSEARVLPRSDAPRSSAPIPVRPSTASDVDPVAGPASLMRFGPRWDAVADAWRDGDEVAGRLALPEQYRDEVDAWSAHPALVDVATTFGMLLGEQPDRLHVPIGYDLVTRRGSLPATPWVRARRSGSPSNDVLRLDLALGDDAGNVILTIEGLTLRAVTSSDVLDRAAPTASPLPDRGHRLPLLLTVAEQQGIVADEGVEMLERLLATDHRRLIASSIELEDVMAVVGSAAAPAAPTDVPGQTSGGAAAGRSVISTIQAIWAELLGVADIGVDEDFFDAGGHSLIAIRMLSRVHKELGVRFELTAIFDAPTIATLTAEVLKVRPGLDGALADAADAAAATVTAADERTAAHRSLVPISTTGEKTPIFVVHGAGGNVLFLWTLARALAGTRPVYGFQASGVDGRDMPDPSIEVMAERYVAELTSAHEGPYIIGGYSGGGIVAFEMVRQLSALGKEVERLVLFDSPVPGEAELSNAKELLYFLRNVRRHGVAEMVPYVRWRCREVLKSIRPERFDRFGRAEDRRQTARQIGLAGGEDAGFVDLYYYFSAAAERYQMSRVEADMVLLKADSIWPVRPHDYHWSRYIRGEIAISGTPGDHWAMFFPEHAPRLAERLESLLDRAG